MKCNVHKQENKILNTIHLATYVQTVYMNISFNVSVECNID